MVFAALRDLLWRRRRYLISVIGCGLVFAMSLLLTGLSAAFPLEINRTVAALHARAFLVPVGVPGPFTGAKPFAEHVVPAGAVPLTYTIEAVNPRHPTDVVMFGIQPGSGEEPTVVSGRQIRSDDEALVDDSSSFRTGQRLNVSGHSFLVVGRVADFSLNAGTHGVAVSVPAVQKDFFGGLHLVTGAVVLHSGPVPAGYHLVSPAATREDTLSVLAPALNSINLVKILLWTVAALIVGSVVFLSVIERTTDFAVFKAIGTTTGSIGIGLALQSVALAVAASAIGIVLAFVMTPMFPIPISISAAAALLLPVVAIIVGLAASLFGLRRVIRIEPALAFGGHT